LADRFAWFGYSPVVRRKPFGPHLTMGALSCVIGINIRCSVRIGPVDNP
jgi:hypothetical protein